MAQNYNTEQQRAGKQPKRGTSIAISSDTLEAVNEYCTKYRIPKKSFVELALKWVTENDIDLSSETTYKPVQIDEQEKINTRIEAMCDLMKEFITSSMRQQDEIANKAIEEHTLTTRKICSMEAKINHLERWKEKAKEELQRIQREQPLIGRIKVQTDFE